MGEKNTIGKVFSLGMILVPVLTLTGAIKPALATVYQVGPGKALDSIAKVPWESLKPGDSVLIHARAEPYREKWVLNARGTETSRIVVRGVPDNQGKLPVIDGRDAITPARLKYWNQNRSVIKIGGSSVPADGMPAFISVENLEIYGARPPYQFTGAAGLEAYAKNASAIYVEKGEEIRIINCVLRDCGNGLFVAAQSTKVLIQSCHIHGNGIEGSLYEHNSYTEAMGITYEFNHFGPLRDGCPGNNLKDRSAGCVIRYNWIEAGNRQLDLVDSDHGELFNSPQYRSTMVYGNVLVEPDGAGNSQIVHYGGDSDIPGQYRKGTLYFYHNTVVSTRTGNTTLFRLSTGDERADVRNNIFNTTAEGSRLAILAEDGVAKLTKNWLKAGWGNTHSSGSAQVEDGGGNLTGDNPGFSNAAAQDFSLTAGSACVNAGMALSGEPWDSWQPIFMYARHRESIARPKVGLPDLGALELQGGSNLQRNTKKVEIPLKRLVKSSVDGVHAWALSDEHGWLQGTLWNMVGRRQNGDPAKTLPINP